MASDNQCTAVVVVLFVGALGGSSEAGTVCTAAALTCYRLYTVHTLPASEHLSAWNACWEASLREACVCAVRHTPVNLCSKAYTGQLVQ
jgi:hypothetical protein